MMPPLASSYTVCSVYPVDNYKVKRDVLLTAAWLVNFATDANFNPPGSFPGSQRSTWSGPRPVTLLLPSAPSLWIRQFPKESTSPTFPESSADLTNENKGPSSYDVSLNKAQKARPKISRFTVELRNLFQSPPPLRETKTLELLKEETCDSSHRIIFFRNR